MLSPLMLETGKPISRTPTVSFVLAFFCCADAVAIACCLPIIHGQIGKIALDLSLPIWQIHRMEKLADHLSQTGKRPAQLAQELGVEPSTITRILRGERRPSPDLAKRISDATGIPIVDLLYPSSPEAA